MYDRIVWEAHKSTTTAPFLKKQKQQNLKKPVYDENERVTIFHIEK